MIDEFENSNSKVVVATRLFTQVSDTDNAERLLAKLNQLERKQVEKKLGQFYYFNSKNPTGHYRLNLSIEFERLVAVRVAEVNNTEKLAQRLEGKLDLTQKGNWENLRNETFDGEKFVYTSSWPIPHHGIFEFDYVSTVRPEVRGCGVPSGSEATINNNDAILTLYCQPSRSSLRSFSE